MPRPLQSLVVALALTAVACTPDEVGHFMAVTEPTRAALSAEQLHALRGCESTHDYAAVSSSGRYRGAYQFSQVTWDDVAGRHYPWLIGLDPATAEFWWQDAMARALYAESGRGSWPVCGRRI